VKKTPKRETALIVEAVSLFVGHGIKLARCKFRFYKKSAEDIVFRSRKNTEEGLNLSI